MKHIVTQDVKRNHKEQNFLKKEGTMDKVLKAEAQFYEGRQAVFEVDRVQSIFRFLEIW